MSTIDILEKSIANEHISHAYIIESTPGNDRIKFAKRFVQDILCPQSDGRGCRKCLTCRKIEHGNHEDVFYMEQSGKISYRVDDTVPFLKRLKMNPNGERNVGIIDNADVLGETVQNKLLKTLEEPFPGTVMILLTENRENLLTTVRSRCVLIRLSEEEMNVKKTGKKAEEFCGLFENKHFFYEYRTFVEKKIKAQDEALAMLSKIEEQERERFNAGVNNADKYIYVIRRIEMARKDIMGGMGYKQALKRLFLEIGGNY